MMLSIKKYWNTRGSSAIRSQCIQHYIHHGEEHNHIGQKNHFKGHFTFLGWTTMLDLTREESLYDLCRIQDLLPRSRILKLGSALLIHLAIPFISHSRTSIGAFGTL
ncbi:hypothetical protein LRAMOSA09083 [Lichtheimia ramosa]|uniref:Uncharacterized protein n=1 Tax=Lichtheimia ramosa TaxID=688394 RepID=A0A077WGR2_9FUNG|nr:hypothetical protein LRAMOSA09083 [Lichtheimia ramosa]